MYSSTSASEAVIRTSTVGCVGSAAKLAYDREVHELRFYSRHVRPGLRRLCAVTDVDRCEPAPFKSFRKTCQSLQRLCETKYEVES